MMNFLCLLKAIYIIKLDIGSHHQINLLGSSRHCSLLPRVGPTSRVRKESNAPESYHILYIIAEAERNWVPTIKDVLTNRKNTYLKFCHV